MAGILLFAKGITTVQSFHNSSKVQQQFKGIKTFQTLNRSYVRKTTDQTATYHQCTLCLSIQGDTSTESPHGY